MCHSLCPQPSACSGHSLNRAGLWDLPRAEPFHTQKSFCSRELKQMHTDRHYPLRSDAFPRELALRSLHSQAYLMVLHICLLRPFHHHIRGSLRARRCNSFPKLFQAEVLKTFPKRTAARFGDLFFKMFQFLSPNIPARKRNACREKPISSFAKWLSGASAPGTRSWRCCVTRSRRWWHHGGQGGAPTDVPEAALMAGHLWRAGSANTAEK